MQQAVDGLAVFVEHQEVSEVPAGENEEDGLALLRWRCEWGCQWCKSKSAQGAGRRTRHRPRRAHLFLAYCTIFLSGNPCRL